MIILNYHVILSHRRSTTVSSETYPLVYTTIYHALKLFQKGENCIALVIALLLSLVMVDGHIYRYKDLQGKRGIEASQDKYIYISVEKVEVASLTSF